MRLEPRALYSLLPAAYRARRATGAPAGAERGSRGPASADEGGPRGRSPPDLVKLGVWGDGRGPAISIVIGRGRSLPWRLASRSIRWDHPISAVSTSFRRVQLQPR